MKRIILLLLFQLFVIQFCYSQCAYDGYMHLTDDQLKCQEGWVLGFEDNFDGNTIDLTKWKEPWLRADPFGRTIDYRSFENIEVSNHTCKIIAKRESVPLLLPICPALNPNDIIDGGYLNSRYFFFTSGELVSQENFKWGKFEAKIRFSSGDGIWPAFWLFGKPNTEWNELDILDGYDGIHYYHVSSMYDWDGDKQIDHNNGREECNLRIGSVNLDLTQWHTYTCINDFYETTFFIDNFPVLRKQTYATFNNDPLYCGTSIDPNESHYLESTSTPREEMNIILNLQLAGVNSPYNYNGVHTYVNTNTPFPAIMEIDYVRTWHRPIQCDDYNFVIGSLFTGLPGHTDLNEHTNYDHPYHIENDLAIVGAYITGHHRWTAGNSIDIVPRTVNDNGVIYKFPVEVPAGSFLTAEIKQCGESASTHRMRLDDDIETESTANLLSNSEANLSSSEKINANFEVIPNPSKGIFYLQFQPDGFQIHDIVIYNLLNEIVFEKKEADDHIVNIDLSELPKGSYIVDAVTNKNHSFKKIFIF